MSPTLVDEPPAGADWITEVKWDGYRTQIVKDSAGVRAYTRNGHDWSTRYWPITLTASVMPFKSGIIDGEVVVLDDQHRSNFNELQAELSTRRSNRLVFVAFDLLHLDGMDLRKLPLVVRRECLERLVRPPTVAASSSARRSQARLHRCSMSSTGPGLRASSASAPTADTARAAPSDWLKVKSFEEAEFDLVGVRRERGKPAMALLRTELRRPATSSTVRRTWGAGT